MIEPTDKAELEKLVRKWKKDADDYQRQTEEARNAGSPHDQMLSLMTALRGCAAELERKLAKL